MADTTTRIYELQVKLAQDSLRQLEKLQRSAGAVEKQLANAKTAATEFAAGLAGALSVGAFVTAVTSAVKAMDDMAAAAERAGLSTDVFQELAYAAQQSDVEIEALSVGIKQLQKSMIEAEDAGSKAGKVFKVLGINPSGKSSSEVMGEIADAMKYVTDEATRTALVLEIFGKSGTALLPLLSQGSAGLKSMADRAKELGIIVSSQTLKAVSDFDNSMKDIEAITARNVKLLVEGMLPALQTLSTAYIEGSKDGDKYKETGVGIGQMLITIAEAAIYSVTGVQQFSVVLATLLTASAAFFKGDSSGLKAALAAQDEMLNDLSARRDRILKVLSDPPKAAKANYGQNFKTDYGAGLRDALSGSGDAAKKAREQIEKLNKSIDDKTSAMIAGASSTEKLNQFELMAVQLKQDLADGTIKMTEVQKQNTLAKLASAAAAEKQIEAEKKLADRLKELIKIADERQQDQLDSEGEEAQRVETTKRNMKVVKTELEGMDKLMADLGDKIDGYGKQMADTMVNFALGTGDAKKSFGDMVTSILADMAKMATQILIMEPLMNEFKGWLKGTSSSGGGGFGWLKSIFNAKGGVYDSPSLSAFSGGIYDSPKTFAFAKGAGVFAEAGPEAIMPLSRGPDGKLGVQASGGSSGDMIVNIVNESKAEVTTGKQTSDVNGTRMIEVFVRDSVSKGFNNGSFDAIMGATFGLSRRGAM